jgi:hypothetical protein
MRSWFWISHIWFAKYAEKKYKKLLILLIKPTRCTDFFKFYLEVKLYMFQTIPLSIIWSFWRYTKQWCMSYMFVDRFRAAESGWNCSSILILPDSCLQSCMTYTIVVCTVRNSWWWTKELSKTRRVSFQNKIWKKSVHLFGYIIRIYHNARLHEGENSYLHCLFLYLQICVLLFERAFSRRCADGCKMQTHGLQPLAEWCITSPTSGGIDSPQRGRWGNKLILYIHQFQCIIFVSVFHSVQVCKLLHEIREHVKDVLTVSRYKEEIIGLEKAVNDTVNYLESNQSLVSNWFSMVSVWCLICKQTVQVFTNAISPLIFDVFFVWWCKQDSNLYYYKIQM